MRALPGGLSPRLRPMPLTPVEGAAPRVALVHDFLLDLRGEQIFEVPVHYKARPTDAGKKLTSVDGFRVLRTLIRCRFDGR